MGQDRESSRMHELSEEEIHFGSEADVESVFMTQVSAECLNSHVPTNTRSNLHILTPLVCQHYRIIFNIWGYRSFI